MVAGSFKMVVDWANGSKDKTTAAIEAYCDAKTYPDPMPRNKDLNSSIKHLKENGAVEQFPQNKSRPRSKLKDLMNVFIEHIRNVDPRKPTKAMIKQKYRIGNACKTKSFLYWDDEEDSGRRYSKRVRQWTTGY